MQRAALRPRRHPPRRRPTSAAWLRHAAWPADAFPLRRDFAVDSLVGNDIDALPLRAGRRRRRARDPGRAGARRHDRARALPLLDRRREGAAARGAARLHAQGHREALRGPRSRRTARALAGRVSGDSTVAYAWAYAMAVGGARRRTRRRRGRSWLRALLLERERIANHLGDLGYLGNDGGLAFGLAQFSRLKEDVLRLNARALRPSLPDGPRRARRRERDDLAHGWRRSCSSSATRSSARCSGCGTSTTITPGCRTASSTCGQLTPRARARARRRSGSRPARAVIALRRARRTRPRALRSPRRGDGARAARATSPLGSRCASTRSSSRCGSCSAIVERHAARRPVATSRCRARRRPRSASAGSRAGAARC